MLWTQRLLGLERGLRWRRTHTPKQHRSTLLDALCVPAARPSTGQAGRNRADSWRFPPARHRPKEPHGTTGILGWTGLEGPLPNEGRQMPVIQAKFAVFYGRVDERPSGWYWTEAPDHVDEQLKGPITGPFDSERTLLSMRSRACCPLGDLPVNARALRTHTLRSLLERYAATVTPRKRGAAQEHYKVRVILSPNAFRLAWERLTPGGCQWPPVPRPTSRGRQSFLREGA
jgi:hypothetical protein